MRHQQKQVKKEEPHRSYDMAERLRNGASVSHYMVDHGRANMERNTSDTQIIRTSCLDSTLLFSSA